MENTNQKYGELKTASNKDKILAQYSHGKEGNRSTRDRSESLEFHYTKMHLEGFIKSTDKVLEIGCGTGYYGFYYADKCKEYHGVDIVPLHIELFEKAIAENKATNLSCAIGDATNLDNINDNSYDVVLCLGPMYHLPKEERGQAFAEAMRVCKKGGVLAFAYASAIGAYAGACILFEDNYPDEKANEFLLDQGTSDSTPGIFYFTTPEEINIAAEKQGLIKIKNLGLDFWVTKGCVNRMTDERFEIMRPLYDQMATHESCTGMANHALLVCRK